MSYKYIIKNDKRGCFFGLFPDNSNSQPIGRSITYESIEIVEKAIAEFKNVISKIDKEHDIEITRCGDGFLFYIKNKMGDICFYREKPYVTKSNCKKGIDNILSNYDAAVQFDK